MLLVIFFSSIKAEYLIAEMKSKVGIEKEIGFESQVTHLQAVWPWQPI